MSFLQCASSSQAARAAFETSSLGISGNSLTRALVTVAMSVKAMNGCRNFTVPSAMASTLFAMFSG